MATRNVAESPLERSTLVSLDQKLALAKRCSHEGVMAGAKAAVVATIATAIPTLASVRMVPWAKANLNPTAQALIISTVAGMAECLLRFEWLIRRISTSAWSAEATLLMRFMSRFGYGSQRKPRGYARDTTNASIELKTDEDVIRFDFGDQSGEGGVESEEKMNSPNPEVRIRYKLEKAKRKEAWLIEKLRKYERTGEKKKHYVPVGRRGVFGGVVLNMHLHWKKHETVKVICKPCKPGQVHQYAEELARLSKGIIIDIKPNNTIIFYRGKNYVQPDIMSPPDTLSKAKALEKYRYEQSLEHTSLQLDDHWAYVEIEQFPVFSFETDSVPWSMKECLLCFATHHQLQSLEASDTGAAADHLTHHLLLKILRKAETILNNSKDSKLKLKTQMKGKGKGKQEYDDEEEICVVAMSYDRTEEGRRRRRRR
ncbi:putative CRM domain-containing protein, chloroplastic [Sesamum angolense]|uniref:CRM domain-containing protein, chloroplastic n=1 Tax=Sesamum angolense TaxID=2727404 RepID=A0AAE1WYC6_9LAMI|nr:putative CRM domain-containing protein, chloroplastic [Sesamum angolense]